MNKGKIVQVMGPVVDVVFEDGNLPEIKDALEVENNGKRCVMEVSHHLGNNMVRCIMLSASEGLQRDREVIATGNSMAKKGDPGSTSIWERVAEASRERWPPDDGPMQIN